MLSFDMARGSPGSARAVDSSTRARSSAGLPGQENAPAPLVPCRLLDHLGTPDGALRSFTARLPGRDFSDTRRAIANQRCSALKILATILQPSSNSYRLM